MPSQYYLLAILLSIAFYTDMKQSRIPNKLVVVGIVAGVAFHLLDNGLTGLAFAAQGLLLGFGFMFLLYLLGAVGAGDVKLFAAIGALGGLNYVLWCSAYSILWAGVIGIIWVTFKRELFSRLKNILLYIWYIVIFRKTEILKRSKETEGFRFPFMYAVIPGAITAYFYMPIW